MVDLVTIAERLGVPFAICVFLLLLTREIIRKILNAHTEKLNEISSKLDDCAQKLTYICASLNTLIMTLDDRKEKRGGEGWRG